MTLGTKDTACISNVKLQYCQDLVTKVSIQLNIFTARIRVLISINPNIVCILQFKLDANKS